MAGAFRRSSRFGVVGVVVVMAACVAVALSADPADPDPKGTLARIFAIVGAYLAVLFVLQFRDLARAESAGFAEDIPRAADIEDPATLEPRVLWEALAVHPIDATAIKAGREVWGAARSSIRLASVVTLLVFLSVPPLYLFDTFVPLFVGGGLIAVLALWRSARLLSGGGDLDRAYEASSRALAPLGLAVEERPEVTIEPKAVAPFRMGAAVHGALVLGGKRHGRRVTVRKPADAGPGSEVEVEVDGAPAFELKARDGRLGAGEGAPAAVRAILAAVPNSPRWNGVSGSSRQGVIRVGRRGRTGAAAGDWLLDLWLAERLAVAPSATAERAAGRT